MFVCAIAPHHETVKTSLRQLLQQVKCEDSIASFASCLSFAAAPRFCFCVLSAGRCFAGLLATLSRGEYGDTPVTAQRNRFCSLVTVSCCFVDTVKKRPPTERKKPERKLKMSRWLGGNKRGLMYDENR